MFILNAAAICRAILAHALNTVKNPTARMIQETTLAHSRQAQLDPGLKEFIDTLLVPMLVRDAIRELQDEKDIALVGEGDGKCAP